MAQVWLSGSAFSPESGWTPVPKLRRCLRAAALLLGLVQLVMSNEHVWIILYLLACTFIAFTPEKSVKTFLAIRTKMVDSILLNALLQALSKCFI